MMFAVSDLRELAEKAHEAECRVATSEFVVYGIKRELACVRGALEIETARATNQAMSEGKIDGKNAEQRKVQLDLLLAANEMLQGMHADIDDLEMKLAGDELALAKDKADARYATRLYDIALTMCKAEVQPA
jgi:hypothetical protein